MNVLDIKVNNKNKIYNYIRQNGGATKQAISYALNLSLPTVTRNLSPLVERGFLCTKDKEENGTGGRNPLIYTFVADARVAVGLDITRNHIKCAVVDLNGEKIHYTITKKAFSPSESYSQLLANLIEIALDEAKINRDKVLGVGIGMPGLVSRDGTNIVHGRVIQNEGLTLSQIGRYIPYPSRLIHDSFAAGFAESWFSPETKNAFYLSLCNSIGGALFIDSKVFSGDGLHCGEVGHITLVPNGRPCYCGKKGCADPYCNVQILSKHCNGDLDLFFQALDAGEKSLLPIWDEYLNNLSIVINDVRMLVGCTIIIGGYIGPFMRNKMDLLYHKINESNPFGENAADYVFPCKTRFEAVAIGSALHYIDAFFNDVYNQPVEDMIRIEV